MPGIQITASPALMGSSHLVQVVSVGEVARVGLTAPGPCTPFWVV